MRDRFLPRFHPWLLLSFLLLGTWLRWNHLPSKPLWMDEVITALFSLGKTYFDIPVEQSVPLETIAQVFRLQPTTCSAIAETIATQSVHPPLFFCWLHSWLQLLQLGGLDHWGFNWMWQLRSLPALVGVGAIAVMYWLNRLAFSAKAGLFAAALMSVSPFAVYLSQEARHYTVPMLVISLALIALVQIQRDWQQWRYDWRPWLAWILCNSIGFYLHYFCLLSTVAQIGSLALLWIYRFRNQLRQTSIAQAKYFLISIFLILVSYLPIAQTFIGHMTRSETDWMKPFESSFWTAIAPLYQIPMGWLLMIIALPVEQQPLPIAIGSGLLMALLGIGIGTIAVRQWKAIAQQTETRESLLVLGSFTGIIVLEFLAIALILQKDLTQVPRYNFIYYPAICALLGAALANFTQPAKSFFQPWQAWGTVAIGIMSSIFVTHNLALQKPFHPDQVAQQILAPATLASQQHAVATNSASSPTTQVVMAYQDFQDLALGTAFALALRSQITAPGIPSPTPALASVQFSFLSRQPGYDRLWQQLTQLPARDWLWLIAPDLRQRDFPQQIQISQHNCQRDPQRYYRIGIPYQGYRCQPGE
ncbi:MAG: glycosyltransferase family 39 protein [Synechococcales bacterium]|nr:glycosyltransferase family 39 protein [Synechococcales bacterium]